MEKKEEFDVIIIGAGAAGLSAAIYAQRTGLKTVCIEKELAGGHAVLIERIENYPGFPSVSGMELMKKFEQQAMSYGLKIISDDVVSVTPRGKEIIVSGKNNSFSAKAVIVATGSVPKELGLKKEKELIGKGVHFCALCDGPVYAGKNVAVVGGGNSAVEEAIFMSKIASKVTLVHRRNALRADKILQERARKVKNISWELESEITEVIGDKKLEKIVLRNNKTGKQKSLAADALFVYIGRNPNTGFLSVKKNEIGMISVDGGMRTSVPGIMAAGDCIEKRVWQIATCVAEGAIAAVSAREYIDSLASEK